MNEITTIGLLREAKRKGYGYDPETGIVTGIYGKRITGLNGGGYSFMLRIAGKSFMIKCDDYAWFYIYGTEPVDVKHINGIKTDNRQVNLMSGDEQVNHQSETERVLNEIITYTGFNDGKMIVDMMNSVMKDSDNLNNEITRQKNVISDLTKEVIASELDNKDLNMKIKYLWHLKTKLEGRVDSLEKEVVQLTKELIVKEDEVDDLNSQLITTGCRIPIIKQK